MNVQKIETGENSQKEKDEPPPFMWSWNRIYITIALYTCILTLILYLITISLNR